MFPSLPSLAAALSQPFKRSQLGLFHGKTKQYGNNVPFSKNKTRRSWLPNIQSKRLYSDALGQMVRVKLSTRALKTIRKVRRTARSRCLSNHITTRISCPVRRDRPVCAPHKVGLARLGGHASTRRSERGTGKEGIRALGIALSIRATYTWYSLQPA
jgi:ribosomal protein L28